MREADIQRQVIDLLIERGAYVVKVSVANHAGVPDLLCCYRGRFVAFELKAMMGRVSPLQEHNIKMITLAGGFAHVVRSAADVAECLCYLDKKIGGESNDAESICHDGVGPYT